MKVLLGFLIINSLSWQPQIKCNFTAMNLGQSDSVYYTFKKKAKTFELRRGFEPFFFKMLLKIFGKIFLIQLLIVPDFAYASSVLSIFQPVYFLPEWTKSVYKTERMAIPSMISCASICNVELEDKCSFFYINSSTCYLGNLSMDTSGLVIPSGLNALLINESK
jgi:hypothetical protein